MKELSGIFPAAAQSSGRLCALVFSVIMAAEDIRRRRVHCIWFLLAVAAGLLYAMKARRSWPEVLPAFFPGLCLGGLWAASMILRSDRTKPAPIGLADVLYYGVLALFLPAREIWTVLWISLLLCAAVGLIVSAGRGLKRKKAGTQTLPYLVFTLCGVALCFAAQLPAG